MNVTQLLDPASGTCTYLLEDDRREAILIDPVAEQFDRDLALLDERELVLRWIVETHVHADHLTSAGRLERRTGARVTVPSACGVTADAHHNRDGDRIEFGATFVTALHTPGHTAGSTCYLWRTPGSDQVFTGDTLLVGGCGRTDFQSGSAAALYRSITEVLFALPDATVVWPGHDYAGKSRSTIGEEKRSNPRVVGRSEAEFVALMASLDLPRPGKIDVAVPANLRLGEP